MSTKIQRAQQQIYGGGYVQEGGARPTMQGVKNTVGRIQKANQWALDNKIVTKGSNVVEALGLTDYANKKTNGYYSKGVAEAKKHGYGKKKPAPKRKPKKK